MNRKKTVLIACLIAVLFLCGCATKENNMKLEKNKAIVFTNKVTDADLWILPMTEKNLKTTVWGIPSSSKVKTGESRRVSLCEPGSNGLYILRMIDTDSFFYSADSIKLEPDWKLTISGEDLQSVSVEVTDENGAFKKSYKVFAARL